MIEGLYEEAIVDVVGPETVASNPHVVKVRFWGPHSPGFLSDPLPLRISPSEILLSVSLNLNPILHSSQQWTSERKSILSCFTLIRSLRFLDGLSHQRLRSNLLTKETWSSQISGL